MEEMKIVLNNIDNIRIINSIVAVVLSIVIYKGITHLINKSEKKKDIIKGFTIISDKYFQVGDVIKYNGVEGKVLAVWTKND